MLWLTPLLTVPIPRYSASQPIPIIERSNKSLYLNRQIFTPDDAPMPTNAG